jgi:hypothetical protein
MDAWKEKFGEDLSYDNDGAFMDDIAQIIHNTPSDEDEEQRRHLEQMQPHVSDYLSKKESFDAWQAEQAASAPVPTDGWEQPQVSETTERLIAGGFLKLDPKTGMYDGEPQFTPNKTEANIAREHEQRNGREIVRNPFEAVKRAGLGKWQTDFEQASNERLEKMMDERFAAQGMAGKLQAAEQAMPDGLYETDEAGGYLRDSAGNVRLSEKGTAHSAAMANAESLLQTTYTDADAETRIRLLGFADAAVANMTVAAPEPEPAPDTKKQKQEKFVESAKSNGHKNRMTNSDVSIAEAAALAEVQPTVHYEDLYDQISSQG